MNREDRFYDLMEENTDDASIQYEIGLCYLNGDGTEKDTAEAEKWLTRAANQGHEQAKALLESGNHGTPEEPAETDILELCMKARMETRTRSTRQRGTSWRTAWRRPKQTAI